MLSEDKAEMFGRLGYAYFDKVLTTEQRVRLAQIMIRLSNSHKLMHEANKGNAYGIMGIPDMEMLLNTLQPRVEAELKRSMKPSHAFSRIYFNGGKLNSHVDREGLDYTMTITLRSNVDQLWPLVFKTLDNTTLSIPIKEGDGVILQATQMSHWRETLICRPDQFVIQLFLHWSSLDSKNTREADWMIANGKRY